MAPREPLSSFRGRAVALPIRNIDTDQIIPARFLKTTTRTGLGRHLFADWRYDTSGGVRPGFILNQPVSGEARVLVAGDNFGCGSSREHAPWALVDFGFRAVISTSFADIFRQNAVKNALLPIALPPGIHDALLATVTRSPGTEVLVDLVNLAVGLPDGSRVPFDIDPFARLCLLNGVDEIGYVMGHENAIREFEGRRSQGG